MTDITLLPSRRTKLNRFTSVYGVDREGQGLKLMEDARDNLLLRQGTQDLL